MTLSLLYSKQVRLFLIGIILCLPLSGQAKVATLELDCLGIASGELQALAGPWSFDWMKANPTPTWDAGDIEHEILKVPSTWTTSEIASRSPHPHFGHGT